MRWWIVGWLAIPLLVACNGGTDDDDDGPAWGIDAILSEQVPTVVTVTSEADPGGPTTVVAEAGSGHRIERAMDLSGDAPYQAVLMGLKPDTEYRIWAVIDDGGDGVTSDEIDLTTGAVPTVLPSTDVVTADGATVGDGFLVTSVFAPEAAAVIIDGDGDYVWWTLPDAGEDKVSRVVPSVDGESLLFWFVNLQDGPGGPLGVGNELVRMAFDGTVLGVENIEAGHHDFAELPDGTIAFLDYDARDTEDGEKIADEIVELATDGTRTTVWSVWDTFEYDPDAPQIPGAGWSHGNALDYVVDEDAYYVSFLGFNTIGKIDRATGTPDWFLGGTNSDFTDGDGETLFFIHQHQFQRLSDSILIFDNGSPEANASRAVEYTLDVDAGEVGLAWSYEPDPDVYSFSLGDVSRLEGGNTLVTFSTAGQVQEVTPAGEVVWELSMGLGGALGYVTWVESL